MLDSDALADLLAELVGDSVERATAPLHERIATLEHALSEFSRPVTPPASIKAAIIDQSGHLQLTWSDGSTVDIGRIVGRDADAELTRDTVAELVASLPPVDIDPVQIRSLVDMAVADAVAALPVPQDGKSIEPDAVHEMVRAAVVDAVAGLPPAEPGRTVTVEEIQPLVAAEVERAVSSIPHPRDGVGVAGALIDREGSLVVTLSNGDVVDLGRVVGRDADPDAMAQLVQTSVDAIPRPKDGKDAFGLEDFDAILLDDSRTIRMSFTQANITHEHDLAIPAMIYRDVWKDGAAYEVGDTVTWAGSLWHCGIPTAEKPGEGSAAWTLAVKRGRNGKDVSIR